jgi:hypothetical protein
MANVLKIFEKKSFVGIALGCFFWVASWRNFAQKQNTGKMRRVANPK